MLLKAEEESLNGSYEKNQELKRYGQGFNIINDIAGT